MKNAAEQLFSRQYPIFLPGILGSNEVRIQEIWKQDL
jgi:hypothetical protein